METAQSQFDAAVKERADQEVAKAAEVKKLAEEELDGFYDGRTDEVLQRSPRFFFKLFFFFLILNLTFDLTSPHVRSRLAVVPMLCCGFFRSSGCRVCHQSHGESTRLPRDGGQKTGDSFFFTAQM